MGNDTISLTKAKKNKKDEFYTTYEDIAKELDIYYETDNNIFKDKIILCPCDAYEKSNFTKYFKDNFSKFGIKKLISTCYIAGSKGKIEIVTKDTVVVEVLQSNGDFKSEEVTNLKNDADIIITNPPFSLFREFIDWVSPREKQLVVVGNLNAVTYKNFFPYLKDNVIQIGYTRISDFIQPPGCYKTFGNINWYQNLIKIEKPYLELTKEYSPEEYPKYDNYNAINVDKTKNIPKDYYGLMGVPITFLDKYNPNQFEIVEGLNRYALIDFERTKAEGKYLSMVNGKHKYFRIVIKRKE